MEEFGLTRLEDVRRTSRLVRVAASAARSPSGRVTGVISSSAEREAAYRLLENRAVRHEAIADATFGMSARRCIGHARVIVAVDQSTVSVMDRLGTKGLGRTGKHFGVGGRRGAEVMSAMASELCGPTTLGLLAQEWHVRDEERCPNERKDPRPFDERESALWMRCLRSVTERLGLHAPSTRPWFQLDRGGDNNRVFEGAAKLDVDFTIRSTHDRRLDTGGRLRSAVHRGRPLGTLTTAIVDSHAPGGQPRVRTVRLTLRARRVVLRLQTRRGGRYGSHSITVVHAYEARPSGSRPRIEWYLLTNMEVDSLEAAVEVVHAYRRRWSIEEFHRAWKTGLCDVESSQLRSADVFRKWATILGAVASRAERLKTRSRAEPDVPATVELSQPEIDAAILLSQSKRELGERLTLDEAVDMIAKLGGYTGRRSSGGPPGVTVITRGLQKVVIAAQAIAAHLQRSG